MFMPGTIQLGISPIAWTNDDLPELGGEIPLEQCLDEIQNAQFVGCELGNKFPRESQKLKKLLEPRGLRLASGWFSTFLRKNESQKPSKNSCNTEIFSRQWAQKSLSFVNVVIVYKDSQFLCFEKKPIFNDAQWKQLTIGLEKIGNLAGAVDMELVYHYHMGTGVQMHSELDRLMNETSPKWLSLLVDTGHITYAGDDPLSLIRAYLPRIKHVHLKDIRQEVLENVKQEKTSFLDSVKEGVFTIPGDGCIDFTPIFQALADYRYQGWLIVEAEQDPKKAIPLEYAQKARNFIRQETGL